MGDLQKKKKKKKKKNHTDWYKLYILFAFVEYEVA